MHFLVKIWDSRDCFSSPRQKCFSGISVMTHVEGNYSYLQAVFFLKIFPPAKTGGGRFFVEDIIEESLYYYHFYCYYVLYITLFKTVKCN